MFYSAKRILSLYMLFTLCFMAILCRIVYISRSSYADASSSDSGRTVVIGTTRGKIYDRNRQLLVDTEDRLISAVTPVTGIEKYIGDVLSPEELSEKIRNGYPFTLNTEKVFDNELIKTFRVPVRYGKDSPACHIVGYVDSQGKGVSGIERAFDKELAAFSGKLSVSFETDALGRVLAGMKKTVRSEGFNSTGGVMLTIDKRKQLLCEKALYESSIESGCAVMMHIDSGDIMALASVPGFDRNNVEASLSAENSPLVNKALSAYSAGSVFKSILAAFALENGISEEFTHNCEGSITAGNKKFNCYNGTVHGKMNMATALQNSCNTYFIRLMEAVDEAEFLAFCKKIGLGERVSLCEGIESEKGILPDEASLSSLAGRANFAFGQGELLVTPLHMLKAYHVLAMGTVVQPSLIHGFCDGRGEITITSSKPAERLLSEATVKKMRELLFGVTEYGIAYNAKSDMIRLAGKTGTAESGVYNKVGEEIYRTWFVGFYPAHNPHYIIAVLNEDGSGGNADCAPVFRNICEWIR